MQTKRELVELAMAGDSSAFDALADAAANRMYAVARLILRDTAAAEDATQDALVLAWRDLSALRDPERFDAWLHRLLVRECYKHARRERRRIEVEGQVRTLPVEDDPMRQSVVHDEIERGFAHLSVDHRSVLVLHQMLGYTFREIAETLGLPLGTVQSRYGRAIAAMRDALADPAPSGTAEQGRLV